MKYLSNVSLYTLHVMYYTRADKPKCITTYLFFNVISLPVMPYLAL